MRLSKPLASDVTLRGHCHEVDVIGHQAPGKDVHLTSMGLFFDELQILTPILVIVKNVHGSNVALNNMMRKIGGNDSDILGMKNS